MGYKNLSLFLRTDERKIGEHNISNRETIEPRRK